MTITTEESPAAGEKMTGYVCSDCRNHFMQPPRCMTCGAQQLYDNTVKSQAITIENLQKSLQKIMKMASSKSVHAWDSHAEYWRMAKSALGKEK